MTSGVRPVTATLYPDEWGYRLYEVNKPEPDGSGAHRWQVVIVARNDAPAEHWTDMGRSSRFTANELDILGGVVDETTGRGKPVHTVAELWEIADYLRGEPKVAVEPSDLPTIWRAYVEERGKRIRHASTIGAYQRVER